MLTQFEKWLQTVRREIEDIGYQIEVSKSSPTTDSLIIRVDFDSENKIARITVWDSGACQMEVIDVDSEATIFSEYLKIDFSLELSNVFQEFINQLHSQELLE